MPMTLFLLVGVGLGALLLMQSTASAAPSVASSSDWPPSPAVQQALYNQFASSVSASLGRPLTAQESSAIQNGVAQAPQEYLTAMGGVGTVAGYQAWATSQLYVSMLAAVQIQAGGGATPVDTNATS